jgi:hypothetical protein
MKLKTITIEGKTYAEVQDEKPVFISADGKEVAFDAVATVATISRLNGEAKTHREGKEAAETKLKAFETVSNLDASKLVEAGKAEEMKAAAIKAVEDKYAPIVTERDQLKTDLYGEKIGGAFARSKFAADKLAIPSDLVQARFGQQFKIEEGKVVAYDHSGNKIYSRSKPGEVADFEEALETIVDLYPHKDHILKGTGNQGSGAKPGNGNGNGTKTIGRTEFEALDPTGRASKMKEGFTVTE